MKYLYLSLLFLILLSSINAQKTTVQTLTYDSTSRVMMVDFPEADNNSYEKILMYYSMRCKDGLVSTGAERNKGCGEWDYSCNTYITDSTRIDSVQTFAPSHVIGGYNEPTFDYSANPTYSYYQSTLKNVIYNSTSSETEFFLDGGSEVVNYPLSDAISEHKTQLLYRKADLLNQGFSAGIISGLKLPITGDGDFSRLRVRMMESELDTLTGFSIHDDNLTEVYYNDVTVTTGDLFLTFFNDFNWNGNSNLIIEISYSAGTGSNIVMEGGQTNYNSAFSCNGDENKIYYAEGSGSIKIDHNINFSGDEISVALWYQGSITQPINSTVFEALDANNNRQLNVHLPWGDGSVYWDCGNDGSGYDRISKTSDEYDEIKKWNHWAFTKNATTGWMRIYLNGEPWAVGLSKRKSIEFNTLRIASSATGTNRAYGSLDDFKIFDKELTADEIKSIMSQQVNPNHGLYGNMIINYDFNQLEQGIITDRSQNSFHGTLEGNADARNTLGRFLLNEAKVTNELPDITFVRGSYNRTVNNSLATDSIENSPYFITEYEVVDNVLQIKDEYTYYLSGFVPIYDENGELVDGIFINPDGTITIEDLIYYRLNPTKYEIMSFVTPYGIGIDFGLEGKTWVFDVTDFGPILKGNKRLSMERGGQFQEEMDIKFVFIDGTPTRDVVDIQQIWAPTSESYTRITNDQRFAPRTLKLNPQAETYDVTAAVTGHGQEGEFIPQTHFININGGAREAQWQVWKECADNPIYPQGGTWIYDRAGWCPGAPTDVRRLPLENVNSGENVSIDYGVNTASGDSRYIVNVQLVSYGAANFNQDAELVDIINPSRRPEYERFNPMCSAPRIKLRNTGSSPMTSARIVYGVEGRTPRTYNWTGNLEFLAEIELELFPLHLDQGTIGNEFYARIESVNGVQDDYDNNNEKRTLIPFIPTHKNDIVIEMRTNNRGNETSWQLFDENGNGIRSSGSGLAGNTTYTETLTGLHGCYQLLIEDSDQDGISWWANNDGNGYVRVNDIGGTSTTVATDFGAYVRYEFVTEGYVPISNANGETVDLSAYPNPSADEFQLVLPQGVFNKALIVFDSRGRQIMTFGSSQLKQDELSIDLSQHPSGMYFVELVSDVSVENISLLKL